MEKKKEAAKAATVAATPGLALNAHNLRAIEEAKVGHMGGDGVCGHGIEHGATGGQVVQGPCICVHM